MSSGDSSWSPPPTTMLPSPAMREKKVYVCVHQFLQDVPPPPIKKGEDYSSKHISHIVRPNTDVWYAINNNDMDDLEEGDDGIDDEKKEKEKVEPPYLDPVFKYPDGSPSCFFGGLAALGSLIYQFGGERHLKPYYYERRVPASDVFHIDTRCPERGWTRDPNLKFPRKYPHGVVYDGKLCVLAGLSERDPSIYGESLKPLSDTRWWRMDMGHPDDDPPSYMTGHAIFSDKLFIHQFASESLYCYDFNNDTWSTVVQGGFDFQNPCASIDEMMYFVEGKIFMAFDLIKQDWYKVVGLENKRGILPPFFASSSLLHLGNGTLCLIWIRFLSPSYSHIHCTKFTVCKQYDKQTQRCSFIKAIVKSFKVYGIQGGIFGDCLAVDAGEESDYEKEEGECESAKVQVKGVVVTKKSEEGSARDDRKLPTTKTKKKKKIKKRTSERLGTVKTKF